MKQIKKLFIESINTKNIIIDKKIYEVIAKMGDEIVKSFENNGKLLVCGNGGSAADSQHLVAELLIRLRPSYNRNALPALSLTMDASTLTACGNDYGFQSVFERPINALGSKNDILLTISTSGESINIIKALKAAKKKKMKCFGFLGNKGGKAKKFCDYSFIVPSAETGRIQEVHITAGHALIEYIEDSLIKLKKTFKKKYLELIDVLIFDFDGVLTNNYVFTNQEGVESVMCNRNDGLGFEILKKLKKKIYIISSEKNPVVYARSKKLKIKCIQGSENKKNTLIKLVKKNRHDFKKILYVGNDINDYEAMKLCKFSACPADSHYLIKKQSNFILKKKGGEGVVTEILEKIFNLNLVKYI